MKKKFSNKHYLATGILLCSLLLSGCNNDPAVNTDLPSDPTPEVTCEVSPETIPETTPTEAPVTPPTETSEVAPTEAPVVAPTEAPVVAPTEAPAVAPTEAPVVAPTEAPVVTPTQKPDDGYADSIQITIDANGLASWKPVRNAVSYEYDLCHYEDGALIGSGEVKSTTDTFVQLTHGQFLEVKAIFKNGEIGLPVHSEVFEHTNMKLVSYPEHLVEGSLVSENGNLSFTLQTPDAKTIRMIGHKCRVEADGTIVISPGGDLFTADEVGKIFSFSTELADNTEFSYCYGYTFKKDGTVTSWKEDTSYYGFFGIPRNIPTADLSPNYLCYAPKEGEGTVSISSFTINYTSGRTGLKSLSFDSGFFPEFLPGDPYNKSIEAAWDPDNGILDFYLLAVPDSLTGTPETSEYIFGPSNYVTGDLKDGNGKIVSKDAPLPEGATLEVSIGDYTYDVPLVQEQYVGAKTFHELLPSVYPEATGDLNVLVVPICWADQKSRATEKNMDFLKKTLGTVLDASGKATEYSVSNDGKFSLSEYYDISSYGKLNVRSFITDWYNSADAYAEVRDKSLEQEDTTQIADWVRKTYPNLDWSLYDKDGNGLIDLIIFINTGDMSGSDSFISLSNGGAFARFYSYTGELAGTKKAPNVNNFLSINMGMLYSDRLIGDEANYFPNVLIHEFAHCLGLVDYYDVNYTGIDAVGGYDMQSANYGDWNVYSKYGVGWLTPTVITEQSFGGKDSIDVTIQSSALNNSALVIPAAGESLDGSPFGEYIMVDLFTPEGVHEKDAARYGLQDTVGVRMYHVHARQIKRVLTGSDGKIYTIGTIQIGNNQAYMGQNYGFYHIELIQANGDNTFTDLSNLNSTISKDDFFGAGDTFTAESYDEFLYKGKMDNGVEFGYSVEVISVTKDGATIRITKR